ncbi:MAG TPA: ankyrin repeat domain-containing protein [Limnobacter sp.]|nr:ankyrin repeat domain-containing protein [Limnobacter sp.]
MSASPSRNMSTRAQGRRLWIGGLLLVAICALGSPGNLQAKAFDDFFFAIQMDDEQRLRNWLLRGMDPNTISNDGFPAITYALVQDSPKAFAVLLKHPKTKLNQPDSRGDTPLMIAAARNKPDQLAALLQQGANVDRAGQWSALHYAAAAGSTSCIELLVKAKANLNAQSENGTTPLMMAARQGREDATRLMLRLGADPSPVNEAGFNAAGYAMRADRKELAMEIMRKEKALRRAP